MKTFKFTTAAGSVLVLGTPTVRECEGIFSPCNTDEFVSAAESYLSRNLGNVNIKPTLQTTDIIALKIELGAWLANIKTDPIYQPPIVQSTAQDAVAYKCMTAHIKVTAEYTRMSFVKIYALPITEYWKYYRDAIIWNYSKTEEGLEKLKEAKAMSSAEPDREALDNATFMRSRKNGK